MSFVSRFLIPTLIACSLAACATDAGDPTVCREQRPACAADQVSALETFSYDGCVGAIERSDCGAAAQAVAECIYAASVCVPVGSTNDAVVAALVAAGCAAEHDEWTDCKVDSLSSGGSWDDDDWD
jgi:hypothetical protein